MSRTLRQMPQPIVGDRVNAAAAGMTQIRIPRPLASLGNRSPSNIERAQEKKQKFQPFLGADVRGRFRRSVLSCWKLPANLEPRREPFWSTYVLSVTFQFCVMSVISVKHNARIALRWVRYLRHPILDAEIATLSDICTCYLLS